MEKKKKINNPTGKGGIQDRPEDRLKSADALRAKAAEKAEARKILFAEEEERLKEELLSIAYQYENLPTKLKAIESIRMEIRGDREKGGMTQDEEIATLKTAYFQERLERERLEKKIRELEGQVSEPSQ